MSVLQNIKGYPVDIVAKIEHLIRSNQFVEWFEQRFPLTLMHSIQNDKALFDYTMTIKNRYMRKAAPLSKVVYDGKIQLVNHALGLHSYVSRVQGSKVKAKNEIRVANLFKQAPEPLLNMLVVHELAHLKEKEHNKAFYALCCHMLPNYHQLEFDARLFMIYTELKSNFTQPDVMQQ